MHSLESQLAKQLASHDWQSVTSLVAVSGGADSVALLRGLVALRSQGAARLVVVHFHHGLRDEADADAAFVQELAAAHELTCEVGYAAPGALAGEGDSLEAAARDARYRFFLSVASAAGARYLFTAHTADDQAETILHRIVRGTGIAGLAGIPRVRALSPLTTIVRPLLETRRQEVLDYLAALGQPYRDDASNASLRFTRNRLRHDLLPKLAAEYNAHVVDALCQLGQLAGEAQAIADRSANEWLERAARVRRADHLELHLPSLATLDDAELRLLLKHAWEVQGWPLQDMSYEKWRELAELARSPADSTRTFPGAIRAAKRGEQLTLTRPPDCNRAS